MELCNEEIEKCSKKIEAFKRYWDEFEEIRKRSDYDYGIKCFTEYYECMRCIMAKEINEYRAELCKLRGE
jgi:hypothetical protein